MASSFLGQSNFLIWVVKKIPVVNEVQYIQHKMSGTLLIVSTQNLVLIPSTELDLLISLSFICNFYLFRGRQIIFKGQYIINTIQCTQIGKANISNINIQSFRNMNKIMIQIVSHFMLWNNYICGWILKFRSN